MEVLFRAKEKNTDNYIVGYEYYNHIEDEYYITHYITGNNYKVDKSTRSINFEDMLDSQGNKIFASLQEDGKGGDMVDLPDYLKAEKGTERIAVVIMKSFNEYIAFCKNGAIYRSGHFVGNSKVIGKQAETINTYFHKGK